MDGTMARNERDDCRPANDNTGNPGKAASPAKFRHALIPLVRLLARQAARDWLEKVANDNSLGMGREPPKQE
jgi:hypothetical protein